MKSGVVRWLEYFDLFFVHIFYLKNVYCMRWITMESKYLAHMCCYARLTMMNFSTLSLYSKSNNTEIPHETNIKNTHHDFSFLQLYNSAGLQIITFQYFHLLFHYSHKIIDRTTFDGNCRTNDCRRQRFHFVIV